MLYGYARVSTDGQTLDAQFDDQCRRWINNAKLNTAQRNGLHLSQIFNWYGDDFKQTPHGDLHGFLRHYAKPDSALGKALADGQSPTVHWMEYDWALNQAPARNETRR